MHGPVRSSLGTASAAARRGRRAPPSRFDARAEPANAQPAVTPARHSPCTAPRRGRDRGGPRGSGHRRRGNGRTHRTRPAPAPLRCAGARAGGGGRRRWRSRAAAARRGGRCRRPRCGSASTADAASSTTASMRATSARRSMSSRRATAGSSRRLGIAALPSRQSVVDEAPRPPAVPRGQAQSGSSRSAIPCETAGSPRTARTAAAGHEGNGTASWIPGNSVPDRAGASVRHLERLHLPPTLLPEPRPLTSPLSPVAEAAARRRTLAIISHPDAGKTTLTEKLLLFGGAIHLAGEVKAKGERRRARSDWMKIEQQRGISVTTSVMTFEYGGCTFNLLDTPGHEDFSEDTYRTLTAVDSAIMVLDAAKGIEPQTLKLFEVCRLRDIPIMTLINKMDREARDPVELLDEIHDRLALDTAPMNWPIGMGQNFKGVFDLATPRLRACWARAAGSDSEDVVPAARQQPGHARAGGPAGRARRAAGAGRGCPARILAAELPRGPPDAGVLRQCACAISACGRCWTGWPSYAPSPRPQPSDGADGGAGRGQGHRLRVQGPGQHGPQAPRPGGVRAPVLGPLPARHEAQHGPARQADRGLQPDLLLRPRARDRRGGLARRHHRRAQPRPAAGRRRAQRGRAD